jgi:hypothetical protein
MKGMKASRRWCCGTAIRNPQSSHSGADPGRIQGLHAVTRRRRRVAIQNRDSAQLLRLQQEEVQQLLQQQERERAQRREWEQLRQQYLLHL